MRCFSGLAIAHLSLASMLVAASGALAQVEVVARVADDDDENGEKSTDAAVSVGEDAIVVTTNHGITLLNKSGSILANPKMIDTGFPFIRFSPISPAQSRWFDGRTDYDPANDRQWISYSETELTVTTPPVDNISPLHLAVSKDMSGNNDLDKLDNTDWWFYTGTSTSSGNGGAAFDMQDTSMNRYPKGTPHNPFPAPPHTFGDSSILDLPVIAIEDDFVYVTAFGQEDIGGVATQFQCMFVIPIEFQDGMTTKSMLNGDRPSEGDFLCLRPRDLPAAEPEYEPDFHNRHYAVQEPFVQEDNAQFFISVDRSSGEKDKIRLAGLWYDNGVQQNRWRYTQHLIPAGSPGAGDLADMQVGSGFEFYALGSGYDIETPDTRTGVPTFSPAAVASFFSSAVLTKNANGAFRIFATHHVFTQNEFGDVDGVHAQWYVINPDLTDFRKVQDPATWAPSIEATGRISTDGTNSGDCYYPSIGVTNAGVAYIEYTFSNGTTWPQVRRVRLNTTYTAVASGSNVLVVDGPDNLAYSPDNGRWADFSDMQADPFACDLWSVHTLVHDDSSNPGTITNIDRRDVWLIENPVNCLTTADLNDDNTIDVYDIVMFYDYFATGAQEADVNGDGRVDSHDAVEFEIAYEDQRD